MVLIQQILRIVAAAALLLAFAPNIFAQTYPSRSITLIVPFAPGGPADVLARLVGQKMSEDLGQQIVVDNRPGANTIIGAQTVAKARPDGYTILLAIDGTLVMNPFLYSKLSYDPFKDFEPVSLIALVPSALTANINNPANTLKEVIEIEKAKPGTFQIGVSTPTSQVAIGLLNMLAGTNMITVPYRGGTTQITSMLPAIFRSAMKASTSRCRSIAIRKSRSSPSPAKSASRLRRRFRSLRKPSPASTWGFGRASSCRPEPRVRSSIACMPL